MLRRLLVIYYNIFLLRLVQVPSYIIIHCTCSVTVSIHSVIFVLILFDEFNHVLCSLPYFVDYHSVSHVEWNII